MGEEEKATQEIKRIKENKRREEEEIRQDKRKGRENTRKEKERRQENGGRMKRERKRRDEREKTREAEQEKRGQKRRGDERRRKGSRDVIAVSGYLPSIPQSANYRLSCRLRFVDCCCTCRRRIKITHVSIPVSKAVHPHARGTSVPALHCNSHLFNTALSKVNHSFAR
jgi:hypothetical protein